EQDRQQHGDREEYRLVRTAAERLRQQGQEDRADDRSRKMSPPADEVVHQDIRGHQEAELGRKKEANEVSVKRAGDAGEEAAERNARSLCLTMSTPSDCARLSAIPMLFQMSPRRLDSRRHSTRRMTSIRKSTR